VTIPKPVLKNAIECLEAHVAHPQTGALHDPLYALLQGDGTMTAVAAALAQHISHPARTALMALLGPYIEVATVDLEQILRRHGPLEAEADPVAEVDRRLADAASHSRVLRARIGELERQVEGHSRTANALAAAGAMVAIFGLIGWLVALGWIEVAWMDSPTVDGPELPIDTRRIR
jgi:hypothetical protein